MFVIGDDLFALLGLDHDGNDFILEDAFVDGLASQVVGTDSDLVAFFTGDAILFSNVFSSQTHVAAGQFVDQAVMQHVIEDLGVAHTIAHTSLFQDIRSVGHGFHADNHADVFLAQQDVVSLDVQSTHAGCAVLVDDAGVGSFVEAQSHGDLTSCQGAFHSGEAFAHDDTVDQLGVDVSALDGFSASGDSQLTSTDVLELAHVLADGGTACTYDDNISRIHSVTS